MPRDTHPLTGRERQMLVLLASGMTTPGIATRLRLSADTVNTHVRALMRKLDATTRAQAVHRAHLYGLLR